MANKIQVQVEQFDLPHPSGSGTFVISVARHPHLVGGLQNVPVLFVLDADMQFALAAEIARLRATGNMLPSAMVVGIGYGAEFADMAKLRTADLTPPLSVSGKAELSGLTAFIGDQDGGADAFLSFIIDVLKPEVRRRYPEASETDHILMGHSLGGLFTAFALLTRPDSFATFVSSSPSIWWDGFAVLSQLSHFSERLQAGDRKPRVLISVGAKEQDLPDKVSAMLPLNLEELRALTARCRMVDAACELAAALRDNGLQDVEYVAFDNEDHSSVIPSAITRGLALAAPAPE